MNNNLGRTIAIGSLGVALMAYVVLAPAAGRKNRPAQSLAWGQSNDVTSAVRTPEAATADWMGPAKKTADLMLIKYGQPGRVDNDALTWYNNGPWKRTIVYEGGYQGVEHSSPDSVIEQTITYRVPADRFAELDSFDNRLVADRSRDELSFRSDNEKKNFLAINLANDIIYGERSVDEARSFYQKQIDLMEAGKTSRYMTGFLFSVDNENARPK